MAVYHLSCENCGRSFKATRADNQPVPRCCSRSCYQQSRGAILRDCEICGTSFTVIPSRPDSRFCSKPCKGEWMRRTDQHPRPINPHRPPQMEPTEEQRAEVVRLYRENGGSVRPIARSIGVSHAVVTRWLNDAGIETRHTKSLPKGYEWSIETLRKRAIGKQRAAKLSDDERVILAALNAHGLFPVPLYAVERHNIDFAWPDIKLAVEYNGGGWHNLPQVRANDERKDALLKSLGWTVLWFPRLTKQDDGFGGAHIALDDLVAKIGDAVHSMTSPANTGVATAEPFG